MTNYLKSEVLKNFKHGFFKRTGGVSINEFSSLNCKYNSFDSLSKVNENRKLVSNILGIKTSNLITLKQIHSSNVINIKERIEPEEIEGDAMVTSKEGICLGILTADCAPILFGDFEKKIIGAAHAGWRGLYGGIVENTLENMIQLGAKIKNICVAIGPCIQKNNYEVGIEFYEKFIDKEKTYKKFFLKENNKIWFDLPGSISFKLQLLGIKNIQSLNKCTFSEKRSYFSFRRNQKNKLGDCGRMISTIKI